MRTTRVDRQARTRSGLIEAADRRFAADGFHATSLDAVADEAGYTKGAVYSNFRSKEDLFFAVYERRVERSLRAEAARMAGEPDLRTAMRGVAAAAVERRDSDDGWLAVFLEFWTHVLRHPEHRARFAELHERALAPLEAAAEAAGTGPFEGHELATTMMAVSTALGLERMTRPDAVGPDLAVKVGDLILDALRGDGDGPDL